MKKHKALSIFGLIFLLGFSLSSCDTNNISSSSASSSTSEVIKKLTVDSDSYETFVDQYSRLNLSGLIVYSEIEGVESQVTDYTLTWRSSGEAYTDNQVLLEDGNFDIAVSKTGYISTYFTISVGPSTGFKQVLSVTSLPTKTTYKLGETFDASGLVVSLTNSYTNSDNKKCTTKTALGSSDYTITIDDSKASTVALNEEKVYPVNIFYTGTKDTLTASFYIIVTDRTITGPTKITDDTISVDTDSEKMKVTITNSNKTASATDDKGYYSPDEISSYNVTQYSQNNYYNSKYTPTTGEVPLLIVPVIIPGYESMATSKIWNNIYSSFFGKSTDQDFESVHSYYYKSSYKQLDFTGTVTDFCIAKQELSDFSTESDFSTSDKTTKLAAILPTWAKNRYGLNLSDYDSNNDGCLDGVWIIYVGPNTNSSTNYWAYTYWTQNTGTVQDPVTNSFGWASYNFIKNKEYYTMIHETGHMLGLEDYYSYSYSGYSPLGKIDMMDNNIGDHNPYSKLLYGWINPYIVYGNNVTLTLTSCQQKNAVIVIPYDDKTYSKNSDGKVIFNTFDEYLVLDFYTDSNLNSNDNSDYEVNHISGNGGRIYHVDNRLCDAKFSIYENPDDCLSGTSYYKVISNSEAGTRAESNYGLPEADNCFDEIRRISADGTYMSNYNSASSSTLFKAGSVFSVSNFTSQFNSGKLNCKKDCSYIVNFDTIG